LAAELAIFALTVALVWVLATKLGITLGVVSFFAIFASTGAYGAYSIQQGVLLDVTWTLISQFVSASGAFYLNFRTQYKLRQLIKKQFEHYLDPRQVKVLQDNPDQLVLGGERKRCTYLFTDVRGFTAMSERLEPEEVTEIMNKALSIQADAVLKHGGMIDKTIGDALMAVFNAPLDLDDHETAAVRCAIEMQENMKASGLGVEIGVGVQTGDAVLGNMGSKDRFTYTVIGDSVNQAARYESATKKVGTNIIVGHETATNCKYLLKSLDPIKVKGKSEPLRIYTYAD
jgi:adenylate cyclase